MYNDIEIKPSHLGIITDSKVNILNPDEEGANRINTDDFLLPKESFVLDDFINQIVYKALERHDGNKTETARFLNISRKSLNTYLKHIKNDKKTSANMHTLFQSAHSPDHYCHS